MNIIEQQEALKDLSDSQIASEMQQPSGQMPLYLISTEAKRRADLRDRYKTEVSGPPPTATVQEDLLRSIMSREMAPTGIAQGISQMPPPASQSAPPMSPMPPMPPMADPSAAGIMQNASPQDLPGNAQMQPQGFANGGQVRGFNVGGSLYAQVMNDPGVSAFQKRRLSSIAQRNAATGAGIAGLSQPTPGSEFFPITDPEYPSATLGPGALLDMANRGRRPADNPPPFDYSSGMELGSGFYRGKKPQTNNEVVDYSFDEFGTFGPNPMATGPIGMASRRSRPSEVNSGPVNPAVFGDPVTGYSYGPVVGRARGQRPRPMPPLEKFPTTRPMDVAGSGFVDFKSVADASTGFAPTDTGRSVNTPVGDAFASDSPTFTPEAQAGTPPEVQAGTGSGAGGAPRTPLEIALANQKAFISGQGSGASPTGSAAALPSGLKLDSSFSYEQTLADKLAELNKRGDPYADQAAKLTAREDDIRSDADANKWMALARAGFGAAAGTSQYGLSNIAEGAMAGLDDYNASQKDITAREDKLFDANTAMIGLQENLKAIRADESYKFAQGMQSQQETNNNIEIAVNNARVEQQRIKATEKQAIMNLQGRALENQVTRASNLEIAQLPPKELQLVNELVRLSSSNEPGDIKAAEILETTLNPSLSKALTVQDKKWGQAMSAAGKVMDMPISTDKEYEEDMVKYSNLVLQNFTALGGNEQLGQSFIIARLGGGTSSRVPSTGSIVNGVFVKN